jgi:hypothetical protein
MAAPGEKIAAHYISTISILNPRILLQAANISSGLISLRHTVRDPITNWEAQSYQPDFTLSLIMVAANLDNNQFKMMALKAILLPGSQWHLDPAF